MRVWRCRLKPGGFECTLARRIDPSCLGRVVRFTNVDCRLYVDYGLCVPVCIYTYIHVCVYICVCVCICNEKCVCDEGMCFMSADSTQFLILCVGGG
jgi:hypothetical protein